MSLPQDFDRYPQENLVATGLEVVLHPTRPIILTRLEGTAVMVGLDADGAMHLAVALLKCYDKLVDRAQKES